MKFTLVQINEEVVLIKSFQNTFNILFIFFENIGINKDII